MAASQTPTYDKSHYSYVPHSTLLSKSIIDNPENSTSNSPIPTSTKQLSENSSTTSYFPTASQVDIPTTDTRPRRSSTNYLKDVEEFKKLQQESSNNGGGGGGDKSYSDGKSNEGLEGNEKDNEESDKVAEKPKFGRQKKLGLSGYEAANARETDDDNIRHRRN